MLLQIHDELIFETKKGDAKKLGQFVKEKMEKAFELNVPLEVLVTVGENWGELK
jgi:DNA polymerase-1